MIHIFSCVLSFSFCSSFGSSLFQTRNDVYIELGSCWKCLEYDWTWKGTTWHQRSLPLAESITFRAISSIQITLSLESFFMKVVEHSVIFLDQFESSKLDFLNGVMAEIWKVLKSRKVVTFGQDMRVTTRQGVTTHHRDSSWWLMHMVMTRHPSLLIQTWFFCFLTCSNQFQVSYKAY